MAMKLTDGMVKAIEPPSSGNRVLYDEDVKGFGVRITAAGARAFVLNYRARTGKERRLTIGSYPDWSVRAARDYAKSLKRRVDSGEDPMGDRHQERAAPDVNALADKFEAEHLTKRRPSTARDYRSMLKLYIRPQLGGTKVSALTHADVERLHRHVAKAAPVRANRVVALLSKMMTLAIKAGWRDENPVQGLERTPEERRERYLDETEITRLTAALAVSKQVTSASAIRLILLTGARRGETLAARWAEFDLVKGVWRKPSAHTKTKKVHTIPLSEPARALLIQMQAAAKPGCPYLFPAPSGVTHMLEVRRTWASVSKAAGLPGVRIHDLRHSFASLLVNKGLSLPIIGALLGHTQPGTTARYSHLADDPLRQATEYVGSVVSGAS